MECLLRLGLASAAAEMLGDALALPPENRAAFINFRWRTALIKPEQAWRQEIERRLQQIDTGAAEPISWRLRVSVSVTG